MRNAATYSSQDGIAELISTEKTHFHIILRFVQNDMKMCLKVLS